MIQEFNNKTPKIHPDAYIHDQAVIIGDVEINSHASIWPGVVLRGDMGKIIIGKNSSIQDGTICHMTQNFSSLRIEDNVTVGHGVILHGCHVKSCSLIGMGSIILDNTIIGANSFVAAGSLITGNKNIPNNSFLRGSPAKIIREINNSEKLMSQAGVEHYLEVIKKYKNN